MQGPRETVCKTPYSKTNIQHPVASRNLFCNGGGGLKQGVVTVTAGPGKCRDLKDSLLKDTVL